MNERAPSRRRVLAGAASGSAVALVALAGCIGENGADDADGGADADDADDGADADDADGGADADDGNDGSDPGDADDGADAGEAENGIDEAFVDTTGEDVVTVETREGAEDEPNFVFDPAFVTVDAGTTIEWVNADGVFHTVTSTDDIDDRSGGGDEFDAAISSEGDTFEWEADEAGTQPYYCSPHAGFMYGAIEIE